MESKKFNKTNDKETAKVDTRYYDELFTRIKEDEEFKDEESLGKRGICSESNKMIKNILQNF